MTSGVVAVSLPVLAGGDVVPEDPDVPEAPGDGLEPPAAEVPPSEGVAAGKGEGGLAPASAAVLLDALSAPAAVVPVPVAPVGDEVSGSVAASAAVSSLPTGCGETVAEVCAPSAASAA